MTLTVPSATLALVLDLLGPPEIAQVLGVSRRTAWRYLDRDDFPKPAAQVSGKRLWKRAEVERWAAKHLPLAGDRMRR